MADPQTPLLPDTAPPDPADDLAARYRRLFEWQKAEREGALRTSLTRTQEISPDRAAEVKRLSEMTAQPPEIVERHLEDFQKQVKATIPPIDKMHQQTPGTATWATNPDNAKVASDDLHNLGWLEWTMKAPGRAAATTLNSITYSQLQRKSWWYPLSTQERDLMTSAKYQKDQDKDLSRGEHWFGPAVAGTGELAAQALEPGKAYVRGLAVGAPLGAALGAWLGPGAAATAATVGHAMGEVNAAMSVVTTTRDQEAVEADEAIAALRDEHGNRIDPRVRHAVAETVGWINGLAELGGAEVAIKSVLRGLPSLSTIRSAIQLEAGLVGKVTQPALAAAMRQPTIRAAFLAVSKSYAETLGAEVGTEVVQQGIHILGQELVKFAGRHGYTEKTPGLLEPGNVDLFAQPEVKNPDGSVSTVHSSSYEFDGKEVLLPSVTPDGRHLQTKEEIITEYQKTGRHLGKFDTPEHATAFAQRIHKDYEEKLYQNRDDRTGESKSTMAARTAGDVLKEEAQTLTSSAATFSLSLLPGPFGHLAHELRNVQIAQSNAAVMQRIGNIGEQSKLLKRSPAAYEDFIKHTTRNGPVETVYAPVDTWEQYWQSQGVDPAEVGTELLGSREAYDTAVAQERDLPIPMEKYAARLAPTEHNRFFINELRYGDPTLPNMRESKDAIDAATLSIHQMIEAAKGSTSEAPTDWQTSPTRARAVAVLLQGGKFTKAAAEAQADLLGSSIVGLAERVGVDPTAFYDAYNMRVSRGGFANAGINTRTLPTGAAVAASPLETLLRDSLAEDPAPAESAVTGQVTPPEAGGTGEVTPPAAAAAPAPTAAGVPFLVTKRMTAELLAAGHTQEQIDQMTPAQAHARLRELGARRPAVTPGAAPAAAPTVDTAPPVADSRGDFFNAGQPETRPAAGERPDGGAAPVEPAPADAGADAEAAPREGLPDRAEQQPGADLGGLGEGESPRARFESGRLQAGLPSLLDAGGPTDVYTHRPLADTQARLAVPGVRRELERIKDELETFPHEARAWNYIDAAFGRGSGNALGGTVNITAAQPVAEVYWDILSVAPVNKRGQRVAKQAHGTTTQVTNAVRRLVHTGHVTMNLEEGALRVAEHRNAGDYEYLTGPSLPPAWGEEAPPGFVEALSTAIDRATEAEGVDLLDADTDPLGLSDAIEMDPDGLPPDTSFNVEEWDQTLFDAVEPPPPNRDRLVEDTLPTGETQPRLPGTEDVRDQEVATPELEAPFSLTSEVSQRKGKQGDLFQSKPADLEAGAARVAELEAASTDEAMGVQFPEDEPSHFPDGSAAVVCTNCAEQIIAKFGGQVFGWHEGDNPTSVVAGPTQGAQLDTGQGHDFAVVDDRYLVDPWAVNVEGSSPRAAWDLENPADRAEVLRLYGDPNTWVRREARAREGPRGETFEWVQDQPGPLQEFNQTVYHGTPRTEPFERFSLHAIGSGEGNQAYGWGLYFASQRAIAEHYRRLERPGSSDWSVPGAGTVPDWVARSVIRDPRTARLILIDFEDRVAAAEAAVRDHTADWWNQQTNLPGLRDTVESLAHIRDTGAVPVQPGKVYTVEIPDAEHFLDFDKRLSQQPPLVQEILRRMGITWTPLPRPTLAEAAQLFEHPLVREQLGHGGRAGDWLDEGLYYVRTENNRDFQLWYDRHADLLIFTETTDVTGGDLYDRLQQQARDDGDADTLDEAARAASETLGSMGIAGIQYLDGNSRSTGQGSSNYVVFKPEDTQIIEYNQELAPLDKATLDAWNKDLWERVGEDLQAFETYLTHAGDIYLSSIVIRKGAQRAGVGTRIMQELARLGDRYQKRIVLSPTDREDGWGTTSRARLVDFYKRFGFVENAGRHRDFSISQSMYREPSAAAGVFAPPPPPPGPMFYSRLTKAVENVKQTKATGAQWVAMIQKGGVNQEEFALAQLTDLAPDQKYTKQEIQDYLSANLLQVEPVDVAAAPISTREIERRANAIFDDQREALEEAYDRRDLGRHVPGYDVHIVDTVGQDEENWAVVDDDGHVVDDGYVSEDDAREAADNRRYEQEQTHREDWIRDNLDYGRAEEEATEQLEEERRENGQDEGGRYGEYVEPGGSNYREMFLTLPTLPTLRLTAAEHDFRALNDKAWRARNVGGEGAANVALTPEEQARLDAYNEQGVSMQIAKKQAASRFTWHDGHGLYNDIENPIVRLRVNDRTDAQGRRLLFVEEAQPPNKANQAKMPPLVIKHWRELAFKWVLRQAAEGGYDGVAWTTGQMQADRYSLERVVNKIGWETITAPITEQRRAAGWGSVGQEFLGMQRLALETKEHGTIRLHVAPTGQVVDDGYLNRPEWAGEDLENIVGPEIAKQILDTPTGALEGQELKVGGEGLKRLYDVDFRNIVNNLPAVKKNGGRVATTNVAPGAHTYVAIEKPFQIADGSSWRIWDGNTNTWLTLPFDTEAEARAKAAELNAAHMTHWTVPVVALNDRINEAVLEGQALFQTLHHGTPHDLVGDRLSTDYIGTGQGAASYGHGLYLSEEPAVAGHYFDTLSGQPEIRRMRVGSMSVGQHNGFDYTRRSGESNLENIRASLTEDLLIDQTLLLGVGEGGFRAHALAVLDEKIAGYKTEWPEGVAAAEQLRAELAKPGQLKILWDKKPGGVYQAHVDDAHLATMIDNDKPYDQQPDAVRQVAKDYDLPQTHTELRQGADGMWEIRYDGDVVGAYNREVDARSRMEAGYRDNQGNHVPAYTGAGVYRALAEKLRETVTIHSAVGDYSGERASQKAASEAFKAGGVPGLVYLDQFSRGGTTKQTRNVVVFDDAILTLTHKNGTPLARTERRDAVAELDHHAEQQRTLFQTQPKGFGKVAPHLTDEEHASLRGQRAAHVVRSMSELAPDRDLRDVALAAKGKRFWYEESVRAIRAVFGSEDAPRFAALLAAMSPRVKLRENLVNTAKVWKAWLQAKRPTDAATLERLILRAVPGVLEGSVMPNALRALTAEDPVNAFSNDEPRLSGPKVQSFYRNLLGHMEEVTNDAWIAAFHGFKQALLGGKEKPGGTIRDKKARYLAVNAQTRRVAKQLTAITGSPWTPAQVQAAVWSWVRTLEEAARKDKVSPATFVKQGKLTPELIANTPNFASELLSDDTPVRSILEAAKYGPQLDAFEQALRSDEADAGAAAPGARGRGDAAPDGDPGDQRRGGRQRAPGAAAKPRGATLGELRSARRFGQYLAERRGDLEELGQDTPGPGPIRQAAIRFGPGRQASIALFEKADASSFLHETGHLFLEMFGDLHDYVQAIPLEQRTPSQSQLVTDYQGLLGYLGVGGRGDVGREQHEKFADTFLAYLHTGKAPSLALESSFARFRTWLVKLYGVLATSLHVKLTPEVTAILDRLVASDREIQQAELRRGVPPLFTTEAESAKYGVTPTQFALYRTTLQEAHQRAIQSLDAKLLADLERQRTKEWNTAKADVQTQVEQETYQQLVYRALSAIQRGTEPSGEPLGGPAVREGQKPAPLRLSRAWLVKLYGRERLARLPSFVYSREGGYHPDTVANWFGYSSGDEMLTAIEQAPPMKAVIEQEVTRRMIAQHGDLLQGGALHDEARAALINDKHDAVLRAELRALSQLRRVVKPHVQLEAAEGKARTTAAVAGAQAQVDALEDEQDNLRRKQRGAASQIQAALAPDDVLRAHADAQLGDQTVRSIRPEAFWAAARNAGRAAIDRAARLDLDAAIIAKQNEQINLHLYRAAIAAKEDAEARVRYAKSLQQPAARKRIGKGGQTYLEQIDSILDRFDFAQVSQKELASRANLVAWAQGMESQGLEVELPAIVLQEARRTNYSELTLNELRDVTDALTELDHLGTTRADFLQREKTRDYIGTRDEIERTIRKYNKATPLAHEPRLPAEQRKRRVVDWFASHKKLSTLAQMFDGFQEGGPMWDAFMRPINRAADLEHLRKRDAGKVIGDLFHKAYPGAELGQLKEKLFLPSIAGSLTKEARLVIALNWGSETSRDRVLNDPVRKYSQEQVQAILDTLDKRDWDFVQGVWDHVNSYWEEIADKQARVTGVKPEKVLAAPVDTKFGQYAGGYYPLKYEPLLNARTARLEAASEAKLGMQAAYVSTTTKRGHTKTRLENVKSSIRLDLGVLHEHLEQVIHDLTHHEVLIDTTRLIRDPLIERAIFETHGPVVYDQFVKGLQDIAIGRTRAAENIIELAANYVRTGTQLSMLGWNVWTAAQQPLGLFNGMARVGPVWVLRGMNRWLRDAPTMESTHEWIMNASPMMKGRLDTSTQDLLDLRQSYRVSGSWADRMIRRVTFDTLTQQTLVNGFTWHIGIMQQLADKPTWLGAYEKEMATGDGNHERAVALADQAVLDSQGGGQIKDLAKIQRGGPLMRVWLTFYSYGNMVFNANSRELGMLNAKSPASVITFLGHLSMINLMPAVATIALAHLFGKMDSDDDWDDWLWEIGGEVLASALNTMALARELQGILPGLTGGGQAIRGYAGPAGARVIDLIYKFAQQAKQGVVDEAFEKAALDLAGVLFHFPAAQVERTIRGYNALVEGETSNPGVLLVGPTPASAKKE